ncbi:hypothetical protein C8J57DRAFT_1501430 [Mycena rebaudengoi]|nr:hypothetical protein C8J57DRAFT_1501430 [Mycena rebaudengoi]
MNVIMILIIREFDLQWGLGQSFDVLKTDKELFDDRIPCRLDASPLQSLVNSLPTGALIPNSRSLSCQSWSTLFPHLSRLVGEHVTKIYVEIDGPAADLPPIARHCKSLRHVTFNGPYMDSTREWVSAFLTQLTHLQTVEVLYLNEHAFRHIAGLEHLENLWVSLDVAVEPFLGVDRSDYLFPTLRRLTLSAVSITFATNFMKSIRGHFFSAIHLPSFTCRATLTSITIELTEDFDTVSANTAIYDMSSSVIHPLLEIPCLRHMQLLSPVGFMLDNEFLDAIARAWSQLESLSIKGQHPVIFRSASSPTIMALHSFSRHCPRPRHLSRSPRTIHATLRSWDCLDSPIDSPVEVANFLSALFPSLSVISTPTFSEYRPQWEEVGMLVPIYARIRADERQFAQATSN